MIRTTKVWRHSFRFSHNRGGVVTTDVEECAEYILVIADHDDGLSTNIGRDILPGFFKLVVPAGEVPVISEYSSQFEIVEMFVDVPRCGNSVSPIERRVWIVRLDNLLQEIHLGRKEFIRRLRRLHRFLKELRESELLKEICVI